jgi:hypothetical protein
MCRLTVISSLICILEKFDFLLSYICMMFCKSFCGAYPSMSMAGHATFWLPEAQHEIFSMA